MPTVHAWFEGPTDDLDAFTERLRTRLGEDGRVFELRPGATPRERTLAVEVFTAPTERHAMERLTRLIGEAGGADLLRGGDAFTTRNASPSPWRHRAA